MELITYYLFFALTTGITGTIRLYLPIIKEVGEFDRSNSVYTWRKMSAMAFTVLGTVMAPLIFIILLSPRRMKVFKDNFFETIIHSKK